jgi:hypothetical protein
VVTTSDKCTDADATAGAIPNVNNKEVELTPYPIPSEPSINWAKNPIKAKTINFFMTFPFFH